MYMDNATLTMAPVSPTKTGVLERHGRIWAVFFSSLAVLAFSMFGVNANSASATSPPPISADLASQEGVIVGADGSLQLDKAIVDSAHADLKAAGFPVRVETVNGVQLETFTLTDGTEFSFTVDETLMGTGGKMASPQLGGGWNDTGLYISLNALDQQAIIAGGGAAIATAICFIPAVGIPACIAASAVVAAATVYLANAGLCANGDELFVYVNLLGYPECQ